MTKPSLAQVTHHHPFCASSCHGHMLFSSSGREHCFFFYRQPMQPQPSLRLSVSDFAAAEWRWRVTGDRARHHVDAMVEVLSASVISLQVPGPSPSHPSHISLPGRPNPLPALFFFYFGMHSGVTCPKMPSAHCEMAISLPAARWPCRCVDQSNVAPNL